LCVRGLKIEAAGGRAQLRHHGAQACLEPPRFRRADLGRNLEVRQCLQRPLDVLQALLALGGERRVGETGRLLPQPSQRRFQKSTPFGRLGQAVGGQKREGLAQRKVMALDAAQQGLLVGHGEGAQGVGEGRPDPSPSEGSLRCGGELGCDVDPPRYPLRLALKKPPDGCAAQFLLLPQGADHPRLIQGGEGSRRAVGYQEQPLVLLGPAGSLHDHRDPPASALPPGLQAFEAVDDLVLPVGGRHDPQGQLRDVLRGTARRAGS
jgi:hypothetical protein